MAADTWKHKREIWRKRRSANVLSRDEEESGLRVFGIKAIHKEISLSFGSRTECRYHHTRDTVCLVFEMRTCTHLKTTASRTWTDEDGR